MNSTDDNVKYNEHDDPEATAHGRCIAEKIR